MYHISAQHLADLYKRDLEIWEPRCPTGNVGFGGVFSITNQRQAKGVV